MTANNSVNTYNVATGTNEVTSPAQPAFLAFLGAGDTDLNVTGNGAAYDLGSGNALTEVYDQNADFNVNGTFTAPVTGRYFLARSIFYLQAAAGDTGAYFMVSSNRNYTAQDGCDTNAAGNGASKMQVFADMDAADTVTARINITGVGANTVDVQGSATLGSYFCGYLTT